MPRSTSPPRAVSRTADLDVVAAQDRLRAAGAGPVAGLEHLLVDEDPVAGRRADVVPGHAQDVGDQPGHRRLAVGAGDRDHRDPALRVPDPGGRRGARAGDPGLPALDQPLLGAGEADPSPGGHGARREVHGGLGDRAGSFRPRPRPRDDPSSRVGRAVDQQRALVLAVVRAQPARPGGHLGDGVRPVARRDRAGHVDEGVGRGHPLAAPGPRPADGELDLDHRLEPVDVGTVVQADLHESHDPDTIRERATSAEASCRVRRTSNGRRR